MKKFNSAAIPASASALEPFTYASEFERQMNSMNSIGYPSKNERYAASTNISTKLNIFSLEG